MFSTGQEAVVARDDSEKNNLWECLLEVKKSLRLRDKKIILRESERNNPGKKESRNLKFGSEILIEKILIECCGHDELIDGCGADEVLDELWSSIIALQSHSKHDKLRMSSTVTFRR
jgi:hypothetical protein